MNSRKREEYAPIQKTGYRIRNVYFVTLFLVLLTAMVLTMRQLPYDKPVHAGELVVVEAVGSQFLWELSIDRIEAGKLIEFQVTSKDVNHGFGIYDPDMKLIAQTQSMPGYTNKLYHIFDRPGKYMILCMEYCGLAHHYMVGEFEVLPQDKGENRMNRSIHAYLIVTRVVVLLIGVGFLLLYLDVARAIMKAYGSLGARLGWPQLFGKAKGYGPPAAVVASTMVSIVNITAITIGAVILVMSLINLFNPSFTIDPLLAKNLTYAFGHIFANSIIYMAVIAVYEILPRATERPWKSNKVFLIAWNCSTLFTIIIYPHHLLMDFVMPRWMLIIGQALSYMNGIPVLVVTAYGALMIGGYAIGKSVRRYIPPVLKTYNPGGIPGLLAAVFVISFWILPRSVDASLNEPLVEIWRFVTIPLFAGVPLALSWPATNTITRGVVLANLVSMLFVMSRLYLSAPVRLCNNFLDQQQKLLGKGMLFIGFLLAMYLALQAFTGKQKMTS